MIGVEPQWKICRDRMSRTTLALESSPMASVIVSEAEGDERQRHWGKYGGIGPDGTILKGYPSHR
jgi:hypothetical protein